MQVDIKEAGLQMSLSEDSLEKWLIVLKKVREVEDEIIKKIEEKILDKSE
jgi:hypothetical protein